MFYASKGLVSPFGCLLYPIRRIKFVASVARSRPFCVHQIALSAVLTCPALFRFVVEVRCSWALPRSRGSLKDLKKDSSSHRAEASGLADKPSHWDRRFPFRFLRLFSSSARIHAQKWWYYSSLQCLTAAGHLEFPPKTLHQGGH